MNIPRPAILVPLLAALFLPVTGVRPGRATEPATPTSSDWNGYVKQSFQIEGHPAFVVVPNISAPGKPWIWRTSFPDYHPEVDLELLHNGFHVAFLDVVDLLGSDSALDVMDRFYTRVREQWHLAEKSALEPCSRGGLHAYRYAARHPECVACIYADVPVMDLKSWPLKWPGARAQVADALKTYGFKSEAELEAFRGNPLDLLAPIAREKIPLRHVISLNDRVVPPEQNTLAAKRHLEALGHSLEVVSVPKGTAESNGHHFPLPEAFASARFVMRHTCVPPGGREFFEVRDGLANSRATFTSAKTGRVAFVGGSITFNPGWRDEVMRYLQQSFPDTKFDFISTGIPSVGSVGHAFRLQTDVLARGPLDLVFIEAAVNDHNYDHLPPADAAALALRGMEGVVRHLRSENSMTDIVEMHLVHDVHLPVYARGQTPYTIEAHEKVAAHYGCPSLNLSREVAARIDAQQFTWAGDFRNLHPSPFGQRVYANSMTRMLDAAFATPGTAKPHPMPPTQLDPASYVRGRYGRLEDAVLTGGFALVPAWKPSNGQETRAGFVNCPALVAEQAGAVLSCEFEGTAFGLFLAAGRDTGVIEFSIDGGPVRTLDTWSPWSGSLHLPWPVMLDDRLSPGNHRVELRTTDRQKGRTALHIIHLLLN